MSAAAAVAELRPYSVETSGSLGWVVICLDLGFAVWVWIVFRFVEPAMSELWLTECRLYLGAELGHAGPVGTPSGLGISLNPPDMAGHLGWEKPIWESPRIQAQAPGFPVK